MVTTMTAMMMSTMLLARITMLALATATSGLESLVEEPLTAA